MRLERRLERLEAIAPESGPEVFITVVKLFDVVEGEDAFPRSGGPGKPWIGMIQGCQHVYRNDGEDEADFLRRVYAARASLIDGEPRTENEYVYLAASKDPAAALELYQTGKLSRTMRIQMHGAH